MRPGATAIPLAAVNAGCLSRLEVATSALLALVQAKRILCWNAGADAFKVGCRSARAAAPDLVSFQIPAVVTSGRLRTLMHLS